MDPLDFLEEFSDKQLQEFFRHNKTEILLSIMEEPRTFIRKLRDHDLIREVKYKKLIDMQRNTEKMKTGLDDELVWLEQQGPWHIRRFWKCVFKDSMLSHYSKLLMLRNSLMKVSEKKRGKKLRKRERTGSIPGEEVKSETKQGRKQRKRQRTGSIPGEEEQPGTSSSSTTGQRKRKKPNYSSPAPLKKGDKKDIWTRALYKVQIPVTCGDKEGILDRAKLKNSEKCIVVKNQWFTPSGFEEFAGKKAYRNWKFSIRCQDTTLSELLQDGHLTCPGYKRARTKKSPFPRNRLEDSDTGEGDQEQSSDEEPGCSHDTGDKRVFNVTCGAKTGTLYKHRFASGTCGKSIRTEERWYSPVEFVREALEQPDALWKKEIQWEGKPLSVLIGKEDQKNDDECFICRSDTQEEEEMVMCDGCIRTFHQRCHLPNVEDEMLRDGNRWHCTFCVWNLYEYRDQTTHETVLSSQISSYMLECQYLLLALYREDRDKSFATDPTIHVRDYKTVVKFPMWLDKVAEKLQQNRYQTVGQFVCDVMLIFTNCATFNRDRNAEFRNSGNSLNKLFDSEFTKVFRIQQDNAQ